MAPEVRIGLYAVDESYIRNFKKIEVSCDTGTKPEEVQGALEEKYGDGEDFSAKLYTVIMDKVEGEAFDKIKMVGERQGILAYAKLRPLVHRDQRSWPHRADAKDHASRGP